MTRLHLLIGTESFNSNVISDTNIYLQVGYTNLYLSCHVTESDLVTLFGWKQLYRTLLVKLKLVYVFKELTFIIADKAGSVTQIFITFDNLLLTIVVTF